MMKTANGERNDKLPRRSLRLAGEILRDEFLQLFGVPLYLPRLTYREPRTDRPVLEERSFTADTTLWFGNRFKTAAKAAGAPSDSGVRCTTSGRSPLCFTSAL
jgi:hypothetical protein